MSRTLLYMDISRLLSRAGHAVPTGIDRVEYEYAAHVHAHWADRVVFVAYVPLRGIRVLKRTAVAQFLALTAELWDGRKQPLSNLKWLARRLLSEAALGSGTPPARTGGERPLYLLLSHHHLMRTDTISQFLHHTGAGMSVMIHDLIPMQFPEYNRPGEDDRHRRRIASVAKLADSITVPSGQVAADLRPFVPAHVPIAPIAHGLHVWGRGTAAPHDGTQMQDPYFVCIGTIEPRKNHLLLLNIWRELSQTLGAATPRLLIIGRRGWENENIIDMLDRCPAIASSVSEKNELDDRDVAHLLGNARALLFPSFTEGFGLPLLEALALDTPIVCSDLPVFREIAGDAAHYLHPLDSPGWQAAIQNLASTPKRQSLSQLRPTATHPPVQDWPHQVRLGLDFALAEHARRQQG